MRHTFKAALLAVSAFALPAHAQQADLVITATRTPTPAARVPARVEIIDRAEIEAQGFGSLAEAIGAPAVQGAGAGQQASVFLRGANSKHVLALFDGIRLNDAAAPNGAYDFGQDTLGGVQRIEVLRGPASAIYGSDAIGGVINMIPRRDGERAFEPFLEFAAGSFETRRVLLGTAGSGGGFDYGISAETFHAEGFDATPERMVTHTGDPDGADATALTASVRRSFGRFGVDALLRVRESHAEYDTFSGGVFFDLRADDSDLGNEASQTLWRLGGDWEGETLRLRLSGGRVLSDRTETDGGFQTNAAESERTFADAAAHYAFGANTITAGLAFERNAIDTQPQFAAPLSVEEDQIAAYLIGQFEIAPWLVTTASLRVDDYQAFGAQTTHALGAVATFGPVRAFASLGTAFKAPSLSERFEISFFNIGNPNLAPEDSESWEVGADWDLNDAFRLGASYYQTHIDNLIEYNFGLLQNINIGQAEIDGAELFAELRPATWASLRLAYAWTDARDGVTGAQLARRPENSWRLRAQLTPTERLSFSLTWTYVGERTDVTYDNAGAFLSSAGQAEPYSLAAIAATYALDDHAELFARVDNITDEAYEQPAAFAGAPRGGFLGVRARF